MTTKILIADDERDFIDLVEHILRGEGYEVMSADNGLDALNKARECLPDVILLDLMLPDLDGFSACDILRRQPSTAAIPVVLVTALACEMTRANALASGATYYLSKPISTRELVACVQNALALRRARARAEEEALEGMVP